MTLIERLRCQLVDADVTGAVLITVDREHLRTALGEIDALEDRLDELEDCLREAHDRFELQLDDLNG